MAIIQLPAGGWSKEQLNYVVSLLEKYVKRHHKGIQVICEKNLVYDVEKKKQFLENIYSIIPVTYINTFHSPISPHEYDPDLNLISTKSISYYSSLAKIVHQAGGSTLIIHCNCVFSPDRWKEPLTDYGYIQENIFGVIINNLQEIIKDSPIRIAVENMPLPLKGNVTTSASEIPFDPCLLTVGQIKDFLNSVPGTSFIFDTSHYGLASKKINSLIDEFGTVTSKIIDEQELKGIYPEMLVLQPSVIDAFMEIQKTGKIAQIQLADFKYKWLSDKFGFSASCFIEGEEINKGEFGNELIELVRIVDKKYPEIPISIDVNVDDYLQREEQIRSLILVLQALR